MHCAVLVSLLSLCLYRPWPTIALALIPALSPSPPPQTAQVSLWWVRHADLRLEDNPALRTAVAARDHLLLPVYIHCPEEEGGYGPLPGSAAAVWFEQALRGLAASLKEKCVCITLRATAKPSKTRRSHAPASPTL